MTFSWVAPSHILVVQATFFEHPVPYLWYRKTKKFSSVVCPIYFYLHFSTIVIIFQAKERDEWTGNVSSHSNLSSLNFANGPILNFPRRWVPTTWCHMPKYGNLHNHWHRILSYNNNKSHWHTLGNSLSTPNVAEVYSVGLWTCPKLLVISIHSS